MSALNGLHRPSLDALIPRLVKHSEIQAASVLSMLKSVSGMIGGPALAGLCISYLGISWTYALDLATFVLSIAALSLLSPKPPRGEKQPLNLKSTLEALRYAYSRQELMGTYLIDFIAMVFAMPNALFPAIADVLGGPKTLGWLYSAPAVGAFLVTIFSGWAKKIRHHGAAVGIAAALWGLSIVCFGFFYESLFLGLFFLCLAGAADGVSGIFRTTIWNETIPDRIRGRMASLEMISYMSGPLLGNAQAGLMSSMLGLHVAIILGGSLCIIGVILSLFLLPKFWYYLKTSPIIQDNYDT